MKDEEAVDRVLIEIARTSAESGLPELVAGSAMHHLARLGRLHRFAANTVFMCEGDDADTFHVLLEGRVKVFSSDPHGSEIVLNICGPGEFLGEMALDGGQRSASVVALESVCSSVVSRDALREAITRDPDIALKIIALLIGRARHATDQIKDLALRDVYQRVTRLLQSLATGRDGVSVVCERLSQQEIADRVGASRDMVARVMKELVGGGYVLVEHKVITLLKKFPARW